MLKISFVTVLFVILASCTTSVAFASEEGGLQTCEFIGNTIVDGEDYEEVFFWKTSSQ